MTQSESVIVPLHAPRLPLKPTLSVQLAAIKKRSLFCIVHRATDKHIGVLEQMIASNPDQKSAANLRALIPYLREWHIEPISGEFLTRKSAHLNWERERSSGYFDSVLFQYTAEECELACRISRG